LKYEKNLVVNGESINDVGLTLGLGCNNGTISNVNIGFELGKNLHRFGSGELC
jgi:hypothetical protein